MSKEKFVAYYNKRRTYKDRLLDDFAAVQFDYSDPKFKGYDNLARDYVGESVTDCVSRYATKYVEA